MTVKNVYDTRMLKAIYRDLDIIEKNGIADGMRELAGNVCKRTDRDWFVQEITKGVERFDELYKGIERGGEEAIRAQLNTLDSTAKKAECLQAMSVMTKILSDNKTANAFALGTTVEELCEQQFKSPEDYSSADIEALLKQVSDGIFNMKLSDVSGERMVKTFDNNSVTLSELRYKSDFGYKLKCAAAVEIFKEANGELTVQEAVASACTAVEMMSVADAMNRGLVSKKTAEKILGLIVSVAILALFALVIFAFLKFKGVNLIGCLIDLLIFGAISDFVSKKLAEFIGWQVTDVQYNICPGIRSIQSDDRVADEDTVEVEDLAESFVCLPA